MAADVRGPRRRYSDGRLLTTATSPVNASTAILAASADGVLAVDGGGTVRFGNQAAADLLAVPADDLVGSALGHELRPGEPAEIELTAPGGDLRVLEVLTSATTLDDEPVTVAVLRDVTRRKQLERMLEASLRQQNAALAMTAHELHSRLAAIAVLAHVLADDQLTMRGAERAKVAGRIRELAGRTQLVMRQLLTSAQIGSDRSPARPQHVVVLDVIYDQLTLVGAGAGTVTVRCGPDLTAVVDRAELAIMVTNYLENALTHAKPPIEITASRHDGWAVIHVTDQGPGVPRSFESRLFERFARAPQAGRDAPGVGLGLWIVRTLARANGGDAWYEPVKGCGSRFVLRIPAARGVATSHGRGGSDDKRSGRGGSAGSRVSA